MVSIAGSESTSTRQEGNKKREDGKRDGSGGGGGRLLKGGNYFKYFHLKGVIYLRAEWLLFDEIQ